MDIFEILQTLDAQNKQKFLDMMDYCAKRVNADEGIPAIIALDDLTSEEGGAFTPAPSDSETGLLMAACAMLYTDLYEQKEDKDTHYPAICPAMSAVAESCFLAEQDGEGGARLLPYSAVVGAFVKEQQP